MHTFEYSSGSILVRLNCLALAVFFHYLSSLMSTFVRSQTMFDWNCMFQASLIKFTAYDLRLPASSWCICK